MDFNVIKIRKMSLKIRSNVLIILQDFEKYHYLYIVFNTIFDKKITEYNSVFYYLNSATSDFERFVLVIIVIH